MPDTRIDLLPGAVEQAQELLGSASGIAARMDRVATLIEGYEDPYGMELLSSTHWVMAQDPQAQENKETAIEGVLSWNAEKRRRLKPEHLEKAWERLRMLGWS